MFMFKKIGDYIKWDTFKNVILIIVIIFFAGSGFFTGYWYNEVSQSFIFQARLVKINAAFDEAAGEKDKNYLALSSNYEILKDNLVTTKELLAAAKAQIETQNVKIQDIKNDVTTTKKITQQISTSLNKQADVIHRELQDATNPAASVPVGSTNGLVNAINKTNTEIGKK